MRQYEYSIGSPVDMDGSGKPSYPILCRSWDDFDENAEAWTRVVNWCISRDVAQAEVDAYTANYQESVERQRRENEAGKVWAEYDAAADWCAARGLSGAPGSPLPTGISRNCAEMILADVEAFECRVREHAYMRSMVGNRQVTIIKSGEEQ